MYKPDAAVMMAVQILYKLKALCILHTTYSKNLKLFKLDIYITM